LEAEEGVEVEAIRDWYLPRYRGLQHHQYRHQDHRHYHQYRHRLQLQLQLQYIQ
jgi:hypothetical protein